MTINGEVLLEALPHLRALSANKFGGGLALRLVRILKVFVAEAKNYDEVRQNLQTIHTLQDESGAPVVKDGQPVLDLLTLTKDWKEALQHPVELDIKPIPMADFGEKFEWQPDMLYYLSEAGVLTIPAE